MLVEEQFGHTTDILIRRAFGPGAGSDAAAITTRVRRDSGRWRLSGTKHFISDGLFPDFFVVTAVANPEAGHRGISLFLVDKAMPGVRVGRDQKMMGLRGTTHVELSFDDVELTSEHLLGEGGEGLKLALNVLGRVRLAQVGEINAARLALLQTAWEIDEGYGRRTRISMVEVQASETLGRVAGRAVQIFGGMGYCKELPIERYYRDARVYRIFDGASEIPRGVIACDLLKGGSSAFDPSAS